MTLRLLLDEGFPASSEMHRSFDLELWRWRSFDAGPLTDEDLIRAAAADGFDGVIFLGVQPLVSGGVMREAAARGLYVAATFETDPAEALLVIAGYVQALPRLVKPGESHILYATKSSDAAEALSLDDVRATDSVVPFL
jgi:hypothetical protein